MCCGEHSINVSFDMLIWDISMPVLMKLKGHWPYSALAIIVKAHKTLYLPFISELLVYFKCFNLQFRAHQGTIYFLNIYKL